MSQLALFKTPAELQYLEAGLRLPPNPLPDNTIASFQHLINTGSYDTFVRVVLRKEPWPEGLGYCYCCGVPSEAADLPVGCNRRLSARR